MINTCTIKSPFEFQKVILKGQWYGSNFFSIYILPNKENINKIGLGIGKKAGKANRRNRIKRLIREAYKELEIKNELKYGYNIVFIWKSKSNFEDLTFEKTKNDLDKVFHKASLYKEVV